MQAMQTQRTTKQRILLVDDEPQVLVALEDLLGDDFVVLKTTSAHSAVELLGQEPDIAVVVTDQRMPRMTGEELLTTVEGQTEAQRIMVTGFADLQSVIRAVNTGKLFAYVTKPWNPTDLREKVERAAEQFRMSRQLASDRQLLHDLLDHSPDGIYFKDRDLRFVEANRAFWSMLGLTNRSQLLGKRLHEIVPDPALSEDVEREEQAVLRRRSAALDTIREYPQPETTSRWLAETRAPINSPERTIVGLVGVARDVTDRLNAQRQLAESEDVLRKQTTILNAILEGLAEGVVVTDEQGNFLLCNREAERILGIGANALSVATWIKVCGLHEADNKVALTPDTNPLALALSGAELTERELCLRSGNELRARVSVTATPLHNEDGTVIGSIGLLRDVTRQREMELRLVQAQKMDAIGRLAGGVAHDFNNLLSVIQSCGDLLLRSLTMNDPKRTELGHILNAAQRAALLTRQLLSFSRQQVVQPKVLQVNDVVRSLETMLHRVIGEHIDVVTQLSDDLGLVNIDASQLEQVVLNLVLNARDAMPNGGRLYIETRNLANRNADEVRVPGGDYVLLVIRDNGSGMGPETQRKMFEPFFTTKDVGKGSGLGLSTVYGIVEQNGGHIRYQTAPNHGTAFEVYLNRVYSPIALSVAPSTRVESRNDVYGTILLVEDEDSVRRVAAAILRNHGYTVLEARRPSDAVQICARTTQPIDLLLTDVVMPESSGPQLAAELLTRQPNMGVMYMSGYSGDNALMGKALRDGITFLQKPFTPALLTEAVSEALPKLRPVAYAGGSR
jgi:two-component system, cell cycle sensor histidine kinase and response regulator CckA